MSGTNSNKSHIICTNRKIMIDLPMKELIKEIKNQNDDKILKMYKNNTL